MSSINMSSINLSKSITDFNNIFNDGFFSRHLIVKNITNSGKKYKLIKYDKNTLSEDLVPSFGLFRSVIANEDNEIVCYSPPKSLSKDIFMNKYPILDDNFCVEELVEGTMINLFFCKGYWEISTKGVIGANTRFFKTQTKTNFRNMFFETFNQCGLTYDMLNKDYSYSFVLQHPNNRIVVPFTEPSLKLVAIYHICKNEQDEVTVNVIDKYTYWLNHLNSTMVQLNDVYDDETYEELDKKFASSNTQYNVLGYVVYNKTTGERMKVRNPMYEEIKILRGNQTKLQFQYLSLRCQGKVKDYLKYYPECKHDFSIFREEVHKFTSILYTNYRNCYVKKEKPLKHYGFQYRTHMYHIHQIFLTDLKEENKYVDINVVIGYINGLKPEHFMYALNYHHRNKNNVDVVTDIVTDIVTDVVTDVETDVVTDVETSV